MKKIWKLCAFLPALFMMGVIFSFSAQTGTQSGSLSHDISVRVVETKGRFFHQELEKKEIEKKSAVSVFDGNGAFICAYTGGYFWLVLLIRSFDIHLCLFLQAGNFMCSVYLPGT